MGWGPNDREVIPNHQLCFPAVREMCTDTLVAGVMSPLRDSVTATGLCVKFFLRFRSLLWPVFWVAGNFCHLYGHSVT